VTRDAIRAGVKTLIVEAAIRHLITPRMAYRLIQWLRLRNA
jgi:hypothetical protein